MAFQALITDLNGVTRKFVGNYESMLITRRLGDFSEFKLELDPREAAVGEVLIAERALKVYDGANLRYFGQLWEPLEMNEGKVVVVSRDPLAGLAWRRVRTATTYTAQDAGAIVTARVAAQNGYHETFLQMGDVDASAVRTITYDPGKREDELIKELSAMADGFFFRVDPIDGVPGKMGELVVLYPDAGTTRNEIRFGYGENTVDNLTAFRIVRTLPITRFTAASQDPDGGRIAAAAEVVDAIAQYGLFEDEIAYTDIADTTLLQASADAGTKPTPPLVIELTPNTNAPSLFDDFDVGDFVRLNIGHGEVAVNEWVRVIEATTRVDKQGIATLDSVVIETLSGSRVSQDPARMFRAMLDANRSRLEALERRVQEITTTAAAAPPPPTDSGGSGGSSETPTDTTPPPPPPPPPDRVPGVAMSSAYGFYDERGRGAHMEAGVTPFDSTTSASFIIRSGSEIGTVVKITPARTFGASNNLVGVIEDTTGLAAGTYWVAINAANSAGQATSGYVQFTVPSVQSF